MTAPSMPRRRAGLMLTSTIALTTWIVVDARWGPDWPAQEFRAHLAHISAVLLWDNNWYGGQALAGYSVLYPLISRVLGAAASGVLACTVAMWCLSRLLPRRRGWPDRLVVASSLVTLAGLLLIGQIPFLLGTAAGLWAVLAVLRQRPLPAAAAAAACSLLSPLAGGFLLIVAAALAAALGWRRVLPLGAAVAGSGVALVLGGASGPMPDPWTSLVCVLVFCAWTLLAVPRDGSARHGVLHRLALVYALVALAAFLVPDPVGGNIVRLGRLLAVPLACWLLAGAGRRRRAALGVAAAVALVWAALPVVGSVTAGARDPSQSSSYYRGLLHFLSRQDPTLGRVEVPFTHDHWEAHFVAARFPLARGWERQSDLRYNAVLYRPLTAARYRRWLDRTAVRFVALPDVALDTGGKAEAALLRHPPSYLHLVWHDAHWRVWQVAHATPLATGAARLTDLDAASFTAHFARAGSAVVRIRASSLWRVVAGHGCLATTPGGWLEVSTSARGTVQVAAQLSAGVLSDGRRCRA